ncbi:hypothetical protein, partial [Paraburkholderia domus]|uniref:hypothetical protein n=1 Tax=Paraburkholderia domus TaxID=2793075 RepID=UPI001B8BED6C
LATTPLRFASPSPPSGWTGDLHPLAVAHARRTKKKKKKKKARIARIRAYRNYYCHAVLMALNQTDAAPGGSPNVQFVMQRIALQLP